MYVKSSRMSVQMLYTLMGKGVPEPNSVIDMKFVSVYNISVTLHDFVYDFVYLRLFSYLYAL